MLKIFLIKFYRQYKEAFLELYSVLKYAPHFLIQYDWETKYLRFVHKQLNECLEKVVNFYSMVSGQGTILLDHVTVLSHSE